MKIIDRLLIYMGLNYIHVPDKLYIKWKYRRIFNKKLNLNNLETFNEKLQWLKLNNRNPLYTTLVDKYEVRDFIKKRIGEEYLIPLLGVYEKFDDINFDLLPDKFVIKCNHDSGSVWVCKNKKNFEIEKTKKEVTRALSRNYYYAAREWPYKNVNPKIIIEKYIEDKNGLLPDYKFYCFNGKCDYVMVCTERETGTPKFYYFNKKWDLIKNMSNDGINVKNDFYMPKPKNIEKMFELASSLSKKIPFVRIDFYNVDGNIYFGEFTFYPSGGFDDTRREEAEEIFSNMLGDVHK